MPSGHCCHSAFAPGCFFTIRFIIINHTYIVLFITTFILLLFCSFLRLERFRNPGRCSVLPARIGGSRTGSGEPERERERVTRETPRSEMAPPRQGKRAAKLFQHKIYIIKINEELARARARVPRTVETGTVRGSKISATHLR